VLRFSAPSLALIFLFDALLVGFVFILAAAPLPFVLLLVAVPFVFVLVGLVLVTNPLQFVRTPQLHDRRGGGG
jgi:hypothetical protein